jgi:phosphohistidine phosphatase
MDATTTGETERTLWLVRHAQAATVSPTGSDADRPLIDKGHDQARRLAAALAGWGVRPDRVLSSPWLRAAATAEGLRGKAPVTYLDALASPGAAETSAAIVEALAPKERSAIVVGHEPWVSALASWWLCGSESGLYVAFRKAAVMSLVGVPGAGRMTLTGFVPMRWVKALQGDARLVDRED